MTKRVYGVYFNRHELRVDNDAQLLNYDVLRIIEFEQDEDQDEIIAVRRVAKDGSIIQSDPDLHDLEGCGSDDCETIEAAITQFEDWLWENTEWEELYPETRWEPAEYYCVGVKGCIPTFFEEDDRWRWWDDGGKEQTLYGL